MCWTFLCSLSATSVFVSLFWLVFWNFYSRIKNIASRLLHWSCCDETFKIYHEISISWGRLLEFLQSQKFLDGPKLYRTKIFFSNIPNLRNPVLQRFPVNQFSETNGYAVSIVWNSAQHDFKISMKISLLCFLYMHLVWFLNIISGGIRCIKRVNV